MKRPILPFLPLLERLKLYEPPSYALNNLDKKLLKYINYRGGVYVEAGANNGLRQSNTAFFEFYRGWTGLLVEPIPPLYDECKRNRPMSLVEQCALVSLDSDAESVEMVYCDLMSIVKGARGSDAEDDAHIAQGKSFLAKGDQIREYRVPVASLDELFRKNAIESVDLLSLDIEGLEAQALAGIDFGRLAPRWILVESNRPEEIDFVLKNHYNLIDVLSHHDRLYRLKQ